MTSSVSSHSGAAEGSASTTVQIAALLAMMASTSRDRRCGRRPVKMPMTMPDRIAATTDRLSSVPATWTDSPCPTVRYGRPHISAKTVTENCVPMWVKKPSRVPGRSQTVLTLPRSRARSCRRSRGDLAVRGVLDQRQRQRDRHHAERDHRQIGRRPALCRRAAPGTAPPRAPGRVGRRYRSAASPSGTWFGLNQCGTSLSTEMNVTASPRPTTARAAIAAGSDSVNASVSWPAAISVAPERISALEPNRSSSRPAGTWAPA